MRKSASKKRKYLEPTTVEAKKSEIFMAQKNISNPSNLITKKRNAIPWTREEEERLLDAILIHGGKWSEVAKNVGTHRVGDSCKKKWTQMKKKALS
ncbi:hypothetical protein G9A89_007180 [Geosiphon pyriformis]|nr:hypothetical protein G9A89_007180 [Geosiphon pyriformis]